MVSKDTRPPAPVKRWSKVLYTRNSYPDNKNYQCFSDYYENLFNEEFNLMDVIIAAGSIYQQFCSVAVFMIVYYFLLLNWISPLTLWNILCLLLASVYIVFYFCKDDDDRNLNKALLEVRSGIVFFTFCFILAPILHSLLASVSTDSIYAMSTGFLFVHLASTDYSAQLKAQNSNLASNTIALSSALLAALCLASRLIGPYHTFALLSTAVILLVLWPTSTGRFCNLGGKPVRIGLTLFSGIVFLLLAVPITTKEATFDYQCLIASGFIITTICLNFLVPVLLIRMQRWKRNIDGPWDEAVLE